MTDLVYIDDEPALLRASKLVLESLGISVAVFADAHQAIVFIRENPVGIVVCDYRMPSMTGLDVLRAVGTEIPFYLLSGDTRLAGELMDEAGLSGFLGKPISLFDLAALIKTTLGKSD